MSAPVVDDELVDVHQIVTVETDALDEHWYAVAEWFADDPECE